MLTTSTIDRYRLADYCCLLDMKSVCQMLFSCDDLLKRSIIDLLLVVNVAYMGGRNALDPAYLIQ